MATEIAKAYVQIIPTAKGIGGSLAQKLGGVGGKAGESFSSNFLGVIKKGVAAIGVTALAKEAVDFTKDIVNSYADYEQLTGGVDTLFKESSDLVMSYAENAFQTAGLSANEYMETVTSFSASLLQSLGGDTEAAAKIGDMAITDMADNANKMGTSMESIQNAYQGFAKQNYTMLDNLKLGYGGTKEEMQRLLADAEAFSGVHYDISSLSDVYEAIHVVQGELGITGTTALEASETISGSSAAMKSSWKNLLTGMADENANFESLVGNFTESLVTFADNLVPRIGVAMEGIGSLLTSFADTILPKIIEYITSNLPKMVETGVTILIKLVEGLAKAIPQLIAALPEIITTIVKTLVDMAPEMWEVGKQIVAGIWQGIVNAKDRFVENVKGFFSGIIGSVKDFLGIASPSKVFSTIGRFCAEGLSVGFSDEVDSVSREINNDMSGIVNGITGISIGLNASVSTGTNSYNSAIFAMADAIVNAINNKDMKAVVKIGDRDVYQSWRRGSQVVGGSLTNA